MNHPLTVLFQPPNRVGLGHINRLSAIALSIKEIDSSVRVPFVVEGANHILLDSFGLPYLPFPDMHAMEASGLWGAWRSSERKAIQREASHAILRTLQPDLVVFDCFPIRPFAEAVVESYIPIVLCLRKMKDLTEYLNHIHDLLPHLSLVIVPHPPGSFELPGDLSSNTRFVGQIVRSPTTIGRSVAIADHRRIVITAGGGGYSGTVNFYNLAMEAVSEIQRIYPEIEGCLITGPLFSDWDHLNVLGKIRIKPFEADMMSAFASSDLVICQGGYNTLGEILRTGARAICIPADRQADDQAARAYSFEQTHSNVYLFRGERYKELAQLIESLIKEPRRIERTEISNGAQTAAQCLYDMMNEIS